MTHSTTGDYFLCEGEIWTVVHPTWRGTVIAENALGSRHQFECKEGRWRAIPDQECHDCGWSDAPDWVLGSK